jgi:hypothetical protein
MRLLDRDAGRFQFFDQRQRIGRVGAIAIRRDIAGGRRIADEAAARRIQARQAARCGAAVARQRIVAAGVEEYQVDCIAGRLHLSHHVVGSDRFDLDIRFRFDLRADRQ